MRETSFTAMLCLMVVYLLLLDSSATIRTSAHQNPLSCLLNIDVKLHHHHHQHHHPLYPQGLKSHHPQDPQPHLQIHHDHLHRLQLLQT